MKQNRSHLILIFFSLLLITCWSCNDAGKKSKPNILFIMADDHTSQALGAYGSRLAAINPTPVLDQLAGGGMLFTNVYCTNSICTPSRGNILTGQYSQTNGIKTLDDPLPGDRQYLAIEMKKLGYETAVIGKWHLKREPEAFDYYKVLPVQGKYFDPEFREKGKGQWPENLVKYEGHSSDVITDLSIEWLKNRQSDQPFFLMHHFKAPHDDFEFAPRYADYLADVAIPEPENLYNQPYFGSEATKGKNDSLAHKIGTSVSNRHTYRNYVKMYGFDTVTDDASERTHLAYQEYLKRYLRCVKGVDDNLARLFDHLKENGQWENTIIVYTSDQGMMLGEHDYQDKRWMYEESMRMPFIMHYPNMIQPGTKSDLLINNTDFAPTLLELAGGEVPAYMQGKSFAVATAGETPGNWRNATYYRYWMHLTHHDVPAHFGIRTNDYKLIFYYGMPFDLRETGNPSMSWIPKSYSIEPTPAAWELYDLTKDPFETRNRYKDPEYQEIVVDLKSQLTALREELNETDEDYPHLQQVIEAHWND
ncbi:sulfatase [Fulvivirgaceae bacterium BMA12]|uniref:Sulfatase n=1 Tax=Agaribacillus aureus TaxID=3051825 RepID=A0ABT8L270_9BACT|nr:sulfatase [Fulvivirgaceae bacterium BMA12]